METPLVTITLDEYKELIKIKEMPQGGYITKYFHSRFYTPTQYLIKVPDSGHIADLIKEVKEINKALASEQYELVKERARLERENNQLRSELQEAVTETWWKKIFK